MRETGQIIESFEAYLRRHPRRYSPFTVQKRIAIVRRYVVSVPAWRTATPMMVEQWAGDLQLSVTSTRDAVSHVRSFYRWAIRTELTVIDPTSTIELPVARRRLPRPARDVAIAVAVNAAPPAMRAMLALMAGAGLRCIEVSRLRWSDVDLLAHTIHVTGKFDRDRLIEISDDVRRSIAAIDHPGSFLFENAAGRPYTSTRISQLVNEHLRLCSAGCTAHQLRHRFATRSLAECGDITTVRDLLGHSSVSVTEIYAAVTPGAAGKVSRSIRVPGLS